MAADVGGGVNYWNANYSGYGTMSKNFNSMRTILNNNSLYSSYDLLGMYNAIFAFNPGGCFSATSAVLMSDLSWKMITEIEAGDMLYTSHGDSAVSKLNVASLGQRRMYEMYDGSLSFTSNHCLWARKEKDYFWSMELSSYENDYTEEEKELFSILKELDDNFTISDSILKPIFNDKTEVFAGSVDENEKFAIVNGGLSGSISTCINELAIPIRLKPTFIKLSKILYLVELSQAISAASPFRCELLADTL